MPESYTLIEMEPDQTQTMPPMPSRRSAWLHAAVDGKPTNQTHTSGMFVPAWWKRSQTSSPSSVGSHVPGTVLTLKAVIGLRGGEPPPRRS